MKKLFNLCVLCLFVVFPKSICADDPCILSGSVYPEEIRYGDIFFLSMKVKNTGKEPRWFGYSCPGYLHTELPVCGAILRENFQEPFFLDYMTLAVQEGCCPWLGVNMTAETKIHPGECREISFRSYWFPLLEYPDLVESEEFHGIGEITKWIESGNDKLNIVWASTDHGLFLDRRPLTREGTEFVLDPVYQFITPIKVQMRSQDELNLIRDWYGEIPSTQDKIYWTSNSVFCHPAHANGFQNEGIDPNRTGEKTHVVSFCVRRFFFRHGNTNTGEPCPDQANQRPGVPNHRAFQATGLHDFAEHGGVYPASRVSCRYALRRERTSGTSGVRKTHEFR